MCISDEKIKKRREEKDDWGVQEKCQCVSVRTTQLANQLFLSARFVTINE